MAAEDHIGQFLDLRVKARRNPTLRALVDRGLVLIAEAHDADLARRIEIEIELLKLLDSIAERATVAGASLH